MGGSTDLRSTLAVLEDLVRAKDESGFERQATQALRRFKKVRPDIVFDLCDGYRRLSLHDKAYRLLNLMREQRLKPEAWMDVLRLEVAAGLQSKELPPVATALSKADAPVLASLVPTFHSGVCLEQNLGSDQSLERRIRSFMTLLKSGPSQGDSNF